MNNRSKKIWWPRAMLKSPHHTKYFMVWPLLLFLASGAQVIQASSEMIISHRGAETEFDKRESYNNELIKIALEKTKASYGAYSLQRIPPMNTPRSLYAASLNIYPNLLIELSYDPKLMTKGDMTYVDFPVDLGATGVRVCFVKPSLKEKISQVKSLDELKAYSIGQGVGWADVSILRANGFKVVEVASYESLFKMVTAGRVDLFCRGANEILGEIEAFKGIKGLTYDESFMLSYPLPRFYFLASSNTQAKARIEEGLKLAYQDGTLIQVWKKHYSASIKFSHLQARRVFYLTNPLIKDLPKTYEKYLIDPLKP